MARRCRVYWQRAGVSPAFFQIIQSDIEEQLSLAYAEHQFGTHFMHLQLDFLEARIRVGLSRLSLLNRATTSAKVSNSKFATWTQAQQIVT